MYIYITFIFFVFIFRFYFSKKINLLLTNFVILSMFFFENQSFYREYYVVLIYILGVAISINFKKNINIILQNSILFYIVFFYKLEFNLEKAFYLAVVLAFYINFLIKRKKIEEERKVVQETLYKRSKELSIARKSGLLLQKTLIYDRLTEILLLMLGTEDGIGFDRVIIFLLDSCGEVFYPLKAKGALSQKKIFDNLQERLKSNLEKNFVDEEFWTMVKDIKIENDISNVFGRVYDSKSVILINMINFKDKYQFDLKKNIGSDSFGLLPLIEEGEVRGVIYVDNIASKIKIEYEDLDNAMPIVNQGAMAIANAKLYKDSREEALRDSLTGLYNKRYLDIKFDSLKNLVKDKELDLSILIVDIDYFKNYNDNNGHIEGNIALKKVADLFLREVRMRDICSRFGGEEFCILLLDSDLEDAYIIAERIRRKVEELEFKNEIMQPNKRLTISTGVAQYKVEESLEEFIARADMALYSAKETGRNKVVKAWKE